jgi:hypothetical protein
MCRVVWGLLLPLMQVTIPFSLHAVRLASNQPVLVSNKSSLTNYCLHIFYWNSLYCYYIRHDPKYFFATDSFFLGKPSCTLKIFISVLPDQEYLCLFCWSIPHVYPNESASYDFKSALIIRANQRAP